MSEATTPGALVQAIGEIAWTCVKQCADHSGPPVMCVRHQLEAEELLKARLRERETPQWKAIESAPKDGTRIIAWGPELAVAECEWRQRWMQYDDGWYRSNQHPRVYPSHWMPLPSAPLDRQEPTK